MIQLLSFFSLFILLSYLPVSKVTASTVTKIEINGLHSIGKKEFLYLLDIKPGKPIDILRIRQGIKRAFLKGIFEDISIEAEDGEELKVIINVRERDFIEKVYVDGDYGLSKKIIKRNFLLKKGKVMRYDMTDDIIEELRQDMAKRGFPNSSIEVEVERLKRFYRVNIRLHVNAGEPERITIINVDGVPKKEIQKIMSLSEGDIYDQVRLKKDLEKIKKYYKKKGHYKPVVGPYSFTDGTLNISVNPGRRLNISIKGSRAISKKNLLKEMPFFVVEDFTDDIVEETVNRIRSLYYGKGYPFVQIAPVIASRDELIELSLFISEGAKVRVGEIHLTGITLPENNIKEVMSLREGGIYNPDFVERDRETIEEVYYALGYLMARVEEFQTEYDEHSEEMGITIRVHEGVKTQVEEVTIIGTDLVPEEEVRNAIKVKPGDPYNEIDILDARYKIIELYNRRGLLDIDVSVKRDFEEEKVFLIFQIHEGDISLFGKTIVRGNDRTRFEAVQREFKHLEGGPLDNGVLVKQRQKLYKTGLFTNVDIEVLDRYNHKRDVLVNVSEGKAGAVEFGLGYADYERFRGFLDLSYRNLWGMNRQASARFELSSLDKRYLLQYLEPWFLDRELAFRVMLLREDRREINIDTRETRYRLTRHAATAGIEKRLSDTLKVELYHEVSRIKTFDVQPDVILSREDTGTLVISGIKPGIVYDTRDNPFDPRKGILAGVSVKFTSPAFLSETDFVKVIFHGSTYQQLDKRFVLALSFRGGIAEGYHETNQLPIVERFFLGGRTTVRGYEQDTLGPKGEDGNPTGGNAFLLGNLELRSYLGKGVGIVAFLDGGNVWLKTRDIELGNLKYTAGVGFRYNTPVGPIRVDYGHKLDREPGESSGEIHFSIGHAF